jgi:hypothetical protein
LHSSYTTVDGIELLINRVHRAAIDKFLAAHPEPEPPSVKVEIWGGVEEDVPDYKDEAYQRRVSTHRLLLGNDQISLIAPAIKVVGEVKPIDRALLILLDIETVDEHVTLRYGVLADLSDLEHVVEWVLYNSTVTALGVKEAQDAMNVLWMDREVTAYRPPSVPARFSALFRDRKAAQFCGYSWSSFCELTGPEQSECVAFHLLSQTLEYLQSKWRK